LKNTLSHCALGNSDALFNGESDDGAVDIVGSNALLAQSVREKWGRTMLVQTGAKVVKSTPDWYGLGKTAISGELGSAVMLPQVDLLYYSSFIECSTEVSTTWR
jgi:hypothetical protein